MAPLSRLEHEELLHTALGGVVDSRTCECMWRMTCGSALLLRELVEAGHATGSLRVADGVWRWDGALTPTRRLSEVVQAQVGELRPDEQAAVELLAVGEPLALSELIEMTSAKVVATLERRGIVSAEQRADASRRGWRSHCTPRWCVRSCLRPRLIGCGAAWPPEVRCGIQRMSCGRVHCT